MFQKEQLNNNMYKPQVCEKERACVFWDKIHAHVFFGTPFLLRQKKWCGKNVYFCSFSLSFLTAPKKKEKTEPKEKEIRRTNRACKISVRKFARHNDGKFPSEIQQSLCSSYRAFQAHHRLAPIQAFGLYRFKEVCLC